MANYYTHFSCILDVGTAENAARALGICDALSEENDANDLPSDRLLLSIDPEPGGTRLWIRDEETGDPEQVGQFAKRCATTFGLSGFSGFQYANTCSRPRIDGFRGGAHVLDLATGKTIAWTNTDGWLAEVLDGGDPYA